MLKKKELSKKKNLLMVLWDECICCIEEIQ